MAKAGRDRDYAAALGRLTDIARKRLPTPRPSPDLRQQESFEAVRAKIRGFGTAGTLRRARMPRLSFWLAGGAVVSAAAAAVVLAPLGMLSHEAALAVAVESVGQGGSRDLMRAPLGIDEVVAAPAGAEKALRFSDGTAVTLERASRGRVARLSSRGARIRLEQGRARVKVVPRRGGEWLFDAGPCEVRVTGTKFDMSWSESARRLEVSLETGSVIVKSPLTREGTGVTAGERLVIDLDKGTVHRFEVGTAAAPGARSGEGAPPINVAPLARPAPAAAPPAVEPAETPGSAPGSAPPPVAAPAPRTDRAASASPQISAGHSAPAVRREARKPGAWAALVTAGEFATVLADARRDGIDQVLGGSSSGDVMALADAARFTGEVGLARRAFLATRLRFAGSAQAHRAAFQLGRLAEDADGDLGKALEWYDIYLAGGGRGPHVEEALGRKMTATLRLFGRASARPLADQYLQRYPQGAYARAARGIMSGGSL